jgi:hypothetical protein
LANLPADVATDSLATKLGIPRQQLTRLMVSLEEAKAHLEAETGQSEEVFQVWNWADWCQMVHALEELVRDNQDTTVHALLLPYLKQCRQHPAYPVYVKLRQHWSSSDLLESHHPNASIVEDAIFGGQMIHLESGGKKLQVLPCRLLHLGDELTIIGEEMMDRSLLAVPLREVTKLVLTGQHKSLRAHTLEVEEFIHALRAMDDNEVRLVLKIKDPSRFTLLPDYHYLGKPVLVTNQDGDLIWAAYVEPCADLYDWLISLEHHVEILDPSEFLADYLAYCSRQSA